MNINTRAWRRLRDKVIKEEPICQLKLPGCTHLSQTADHIIPRSQHPELSMTRANLRGACEACNRKRGNKPADYNQPPRALGFFK